MSKRMIKCWVVVLFAALLALQGSAAATNVERKIKTKVTPIYPALAKEMRVNGTVRMEVVIGANGAIKSMRALGGHPLLIQSATDALKRWRYEPGPETTTVIEFHFQD